MLRDSLVKETKFFLDLIDVAPVNSHVVYTKLDNDISLLNFKTIVKKVPHQSVKQEKISWTIQAQRSPNPYTTVLGETNEMP